MSDNLHHAWAEAVLTAAGGRRHGERDEEAAFNDRQQLAPRGDDYVSVPFDPVKTVEVQYTHGGELPPMPYGEK